MVAKHSIAKPKHSQGMNNLFDDSMAIIPPARKKIFLIMKFTTTLILAAWHHVSAKGFSLSHLISKMSSLKKVFRVIQLQSGYLFIYNDKVIENAAPVTIRIRDEDIEEVMERCMKHMALDYQIKERTIFIKGKQPGMLYR
ncbi:MAG: hypothetical protein JWM28_559 [Chitinophagaceae bacterium]|nr:hypothetical protein [Chitinophagaceae bacterium]